jgi:AraC-like DNA-binding protein
MNEMSCSTVVIQAFVRALALYPDAPVATEAMRALDGRGRVTLSLAYASIRRWVYATHDEDLGLRAGATMHVGSCGALDFAMRTAPSLRESVAIAAEYHELVNDALTPALYEDSEHAFIELSRNTEWPRAVADFTMSAWYLSHVRDLLPLACPLEVWFAHEQPASISEYLGVFAPAQLRFAAPRYGFRFPRELANAPLETGDAALHALHCEYLELLLSGLGHSASTGRRVRALLSSDLLGGRRTADSIAHMLHISRRTLVRRLSREGTTFMTQRDGHRRQLAIHLIETSDLPLQEVSDLLGFSHVQGFHRAFKRWSGVTPKRYREAAHSKKSPQDQTERSITPLR